MQMGLLLLLPNVRIRWVSACGYLMHSLKSKKQAARTLITMTHHQLATAGARVPLPLCQSPYAPDAPRRKSKYPGPSWGNGPSAFSRNVAVVSRRMRVSTFATPSNDRMGDLLSAEMLLLFHGACESAPLPPLHSPNWHKVWLTTESVFRNELVIVHISNWYIF